MENETFLISSYFFVGLVCACLGLAAYLWLRPAAEQVFGALKQKQWQESLRRAFPFSMVLFAFSAFLSVTYIGCAGRTYNDVVSDRAYIWSINERQISTSLRAIVFAVIVWAVVIAINLLAIRREKANPPNKDRPASR